VRLSPVLDPFSQSSSVTGRLGQIDKGNYAIGTDRRLRNAEVTVLLEILIGLLA
jgi:hypothetical protein